MRQVAAFHLLVALIIVVPVPVASAWSMIAYGDSLTSDPTSNSFKWCGERITPPDTCEARGVGSETTTVGVDRLLADLQLGLIPESTDYVALAWGANDLRSGVWDAEGQLFAPLRMAAVALTQSGHVPVFWAPNPQFEIAMPPFVVSQIVDERISEVVAPGIMDLASEFDSAPVADHFSAYWSLGETAMALLYVDHVHQNADGYAYMANTVQEIVTEHYLSVPEPRAVTQSIAALAAVAAVAAFRRARERLTSRGVW